MIASLIPLVLALAASVSAAPTGRDVRPAKPSGAPAGAFRATIHPSGDDTKCLVAGGAVQTCDYNNPASYWFTMYGPTFFQNANDGQCLSLGEFESGTTGLVDPIWGQSASELPCTQPWPQMGPWSNDPSPIKFMRRDDAIILSDQGKWCLSVNTAGTLAGAIQCSGDAAQKWTIREHW